MMRVRGTLVLLAGMFAIGCGRSKPELTVVADPASAVSTAAGQPSADAPKPPANPFAFADDAEGRALAGVLRPTLGVPLESPDAREWTPPPTPAAVERPGSGPPVGPRRPPTLPGPPVPEPPPAPPADEFPEGLAPERPEPPRPIAFPVAAGPAWPGHAADRASEPPLARPADLAPPVGDVTRRQSGAAALAARIATASRPTPAELAADEARPPLPEPDPLTAPGLFPRRDRP